MKKLPLFLLASTLTALLSAQAETVVFDDTFGSGSTLNSGSPANPTANSTAYQMLSSKSWSGESVGADQLRIAMVGTSSGYMECQTLFATNPVTLDNDLDSLELRVTFTNTAGLVSAANGQLNFGLYNSGGTAGSIKPVPGGLQGTLTSSQTGNASGNAQGWVGYFGQMLYDGGNHQILTREAQTGSDNRNQSTANTGSGSISPANPAPVSVGTPVGSTLALVEGSVYTDVLKITKSGTNTLLITNTLYAGPEPSGVILASAGAVATNSTYLTSAFDSLSIAWRATGGPATTMDVTKLTVTKYTKADLPALYNIQLNGHETLPYSGPGYIGNSGDVWNSPQWTGVDPGVSTNLFTGVTVLDSTGSDNGVTADWTALQNGNSGGWNTGPFNRYSGQTSGSATPGLMDLVVKSDWHGSANIHTLTLSGLPANKPVSAYVYGSGNGAGQGSTWTMDAANGGDSAAIDYDGSATGRDITLASSQGTGWELISGTTDGSGQLIIRATEGPGSVWWQTYLNGIQVRVGGTPPSIIGLTDLNVEDGTTVVLSPVVTGNPVPTYQWQENGIDLTGETNGSLTLPNVTTNENGNVYSLIAANPLGTVTNSMTLTVFEAVYSDMAVTAMSPVNSAADICSDTLLTVTFDDAPSLGTSGAIKIFDASNPGTPVDTIHAADGAVQQRNFPGDGQSFTYPTFDFDGNTVTIHPHFNVLAPDTTYYVTIDPKTFLDSGGTNYVGLTDTNAWRFTTKSAPADPDNPVVNADGSGDFLTVQGAVNSFVAPYTTRRIVHVRDGLYHEIVNISGKDNVTIRGESRAGTLVGFENNATYQTANGGTTHARMSFKVNADDIAIESITLTNMTPQGGSQAEAFMLETGAARCVVHDATIVSRQDTILVNTYTSQAYFHQSSIIGNFDYIWGGGNVFFDECNIHTITGAGSGNITAARTTTQGSSDATFQWLNPGGTYTANGLSFVGCTFTADGGIANTTLAGNNGTAGNLVSWAFCQFQDNHVTPSSTLFGGNYLFWQHENTDLSSNPVSYSALTTLPGGDARLMEATNATAWLYGWVPTLLPTIQAQPENQSATVGGAAAFTVVASGIPAPTYQWKLDGAILPGETNATLNVTGIDSGDEGDYTVDVSNAAGTVTSDVATLTLLAAMEYVALSPANGASGVCYDALLTITFNQEPVAGSTGSIRIFNATDPVTPVDEIDLSLGNVQTRTFPGDAQVFNVYSVLVDGSNATIYPHANVMEPDQTYYVTIDAGVFEDTSGGLFPGISDTNEWRFSTKSAPVDPTDVVVAADGSGDFCTVQGAINSVPAANVTPVTINVMDGDYIELVNISDRNNILIRGESRENTIIGYANNANLAPGGSTHARMAFKVNSHDISIDNLTITNRTPQGGSQAEALMLETDIKRFVANNAKIASYQDTILANTPGTQGYLNDCLVQGDVDFIWGGGNVYFTNCEIRTLRENSAVTQPRQPAGSNGFSFVSCEFTRSSPSITGCLFTRTLANPAFRFSSVALIDCLIDSHIDDWETDYLIVFGGQKNPNLRWWEYGNSNITATAAAVYSGHQLTNGDPRLELARYATNWLGGWSPQLAPNILGQPSNQVVNQGDPAVFTVVATGVPAPTYQWKHEGTNLVGETGATLSIASAQAADAGDYVVEVSNAAGTVTSVVATLTVASAGPVVSAPTILGDGNFQLTASGNEGETYRVWASDDVTLAPIESTWTLIESNVFGAGPVVITDLDATNHALRFYLITVP